MIHTENNNDCYLKITDVAKYFSVTSQTIRNWVKEKTFPNGEVFSPKVRRWKKSEIEQYSEKVKQE